MIINSYIFGGFDPDAQAFITAANITDNTQKTAINQLVLDLKGYNIWTKFIAIYPYVGGTANSHKFNLKNPLDTNAAFRIVWNGGVTHNSDGIIGNGTNGYGETYITPSTSMSLNDSHISFYSRTNIQTTTNDIGIADTLGNRGINIVARTTTNVSQYYVNDFNINAVSNNNGDGFFVATRTASNVKKLFRNGNTLSSVTTASVSLPAVSIPVLGRKNYNGMNGYVAKNHSFASIGSGLTDTDIVNLSWITEQYQTTLGRSVNPWYNNGNLLLDNYPSAAVAYSVRKLRNYYIGAAIRVRRSSDNAEQDIFFDSTGNLDTASLLSFVGAGNGFVTTWYDQSGNGRNATQTTAANQPQIVSAGSLLTITGVGSARPILRFDGTNDNFDFSAITAPQFTSFYPQKKNNTNSLSAWIAGTVSGNPYTPVIFRTFGTYISNTTTITYSTTYNNNNYILMSGYVNSSNAGFIQINNSAITLGSTLSATAGTFSKIGARTSPSPEYSQCDVPEMILYASDNSANISAINTNINNYYQIY